MAVNVESGKHSFFLPGSILQAIPGTFVMRALRSYHPDSLHALNGRLEAFNLGLLPDPREGGVILATSEPSFAGPISPANPLLLLLKSE